MVLDMQESTPVHGFTVLFLERLQACNAEALKPLRGDGVEVLRCSFLKEEKNTEGGSGHGQQSTCHKTALKGKGATRT